LPVAGNVGGVGIYVRSDLSHNIIDNYKIANSKECPVESLWIEVTNQRLQ